jgi:predicted alpha/beta-hydrolase family hydrolase
MGDSIELTEYPSSSPRAAILLAHGAGAGQSSPFMVRAAGGLAARQVSAATFDFPYITARRKVPDRAPALEAAWRQAVSAGRSRFGSLPLFIGGKSMGGRIASHIAAQGGAGDLGGVVFFGYPLHPPAKPQRRRDAHLPEIAEPLLFVQGSRDPFGTVDEIRALLPSLRRATLHEVVGGDHSLKAPARKGGRDAVEEALDAAAAWIHALVAA